MKYPESFSLSLQKHFSAKPRMAFKHLKIGFLLYSCGIFKEKGIDTMTLYYGLSWFHFGCCHIGRVESKRPVETGTDTCNANRHEQSKVKASGGRKTPGCQI